MLLVGRYVSPRVRRVSDRLILADVAVAIRWRSLHSLSPIGRSPRSLSATRGPRTTMPSPFDLCRMPAGVRLNLAAPGDSGITTRGGFDAPPPYRDTSSAPPFEMSRSRGGHCNAD